MNTTTAAALPAKPHRTEIWGILPDKRKVPHGWPACLRRQPPRVAFRNNDIYIVDNEESSNYEEPEGEAPQGPIQVMSMQKSHSQKYAS